MTTFNELKKSALKSCKESKTPMTLNCAVCNILDKMPTEELCKFFIASFLGGEATLRNMIEEQIIGAVINAVRYDEAVK